jgi:ABC-type cobalamin/Fe3+-siderophores transport system ATPase subunit
MKTNRFISLRVIGGFLDGLNLMFDTGLTCLIGARGTGKSTILELIRFTLDLLPRKDLSAAARKRLDSIISGNLNGGRVELEVETADGARYFVSRVQGEEPIVMDKERNPVPVKLPGFFRAEIFSQNEVEGIADQKRFQLDLIDSFAPDEIDSLEWEIEDLSASIVHVAQEASPLRMEVQMLDEKLKQLPNIEERLKCYKMEGDSSAEELDKAHVAKAQRDRESRVFKGTNDVLARFRTDVQGMVGKLKGELSGKFTNDLKNGANRALIEQSIENLREAIQKTDQQFNLALAAVDACQKKQEELGSILNEQHQTQEIAFRELVEKHSDFQRKSAERAGLDRQMNEFVDLQRTHKEREEQIARLEARQAELLQKLSEERDKRFNIRQQIADKLNKVLLPDVRVTLAQDGDTTCYRELLEERLKPTGMRHGTVAQRLSQAVPPTQLADMVSAGDLKSLAEHGNLNPEQAAKVVQAYKDPVSLAQLRSVELRDQPLIELRDGATYKDSSTLSTGQKCTTILPILLLDSINPLLIDQPEDNLDNRFIYQTVVSKIEQARESRQLMFITHNPNIPVLGEAGEVVVMESDGEHARVLTHGDVDQCRDSIINLLEGGEEAFRQRGNRYRIARK